MNSLCFSAGIGAAWLNAFVHMSHKSYHFDYIHSLHAYFLCVISCIELCPTKSNLPQKNSKHHATSSNIMKCHDFDDRKFTPFFLRGFLYRIGPSSMVTFVQNVLLPHYRVSISTNIWDASSNSVITVFFICLLATQLKERFGTSTEISCGSFWLLSSLGCCA